MSIPAIRRNIQRSFYTPNTLTAAPLARQNCRPVTLSLEKIAETWLGGILKKMNKMVIVGY